MKAIEENQRRKNTTFKPPGLPDFENGADSYPPDLQDEAVKTVLAQAELLSAEWAEGYV